MSNFVSLSTALTALRAAQTGMDVTSHNIANANTKGYTRQRVGLTTGTPYQTPVGTLGTGVKVSDVSRIRDTFLDMRLHASNATLGNLEVSANLLERAEGMLGEPDFGLTSELNEVWAAFDELAVRPSDNSVRLTVLSALESFATRMRTIADSFEALGSDAQVQLESDLAGANDQIGQLRDLNVQITSVQASGASVPNDLLDRRDLLVDDLSRTLGATATYAENGTARLSLNGFDLVSDNRANTLELQSDNTLLHPSGGTVPAGGRVKGFVAFIASELPEIQAGLDAFAEEFVEQLNFQHAQGFDLQDPPVAGGDLFSLPDGADSIALAFTDPALLAASNGTGALDGSNALRLAMLRVDPAQAGDPVLEAELRGLVTDLGATVASRLRQGAAEEGLNAAAAQVRRNHNAVSLDEEMVSLITYQRSYEAAARIATAVDETLATVVSRLGIVGR